VLGASLSHGYGLEREVGARVRFSDLIEASLCTEHEPVQPRTSLVFFADPLPTGQAMVAAGKAVDPTLVVGIDYLFWFGYGAFKTEDDRMAMLDRGLALLETFSCPVLVGDLPDVRDASGDPSSGRGRGLLAPEQVPGPESLKNLNERLRGWANTRKNVVVVPLADLVARLHSGKDVEIHGNRWSGEALGGLIQKDRLHPTLQGAIALWLGAIDALVAARPDVPASAFHWDAKTISKQIYDSKEKERAARKGRARPGGGTVLPPAPVPEDAGHGSNDGGSKDGERGRGGLSSFPSDSHHVVAGVHVDDAARDPARHRAHQEETGVSDLFGRDVAP
jgi:hypothetical protein